MFSKKSIANFIINVSGALLDLGQAMEREAKDDEAFQKDLEWKPPTDNAPDPPLMSADLEDELASPPMNTDALPAAPTVDLESRLLFFLSSNPNSRMDQVFAAVAGDKAAVSKLVKALVTRGRLVTTGINRAKSYSVVAEQQEAAE